jgi:hypothetical protein
MMARSIYRRRRILGAAIVAIAVFSLGAQAQKAYIVDKTSVGIRAGKTVSDSLLGVAETGESLEILATEDGFVRVRTPEGIEGWLGIEYVMAELPARDRVAQLEASLEEALSALAAIDKSTEAHTMAASGQPRSGASESSVWSVLLALISLGAGFLLGYRYSTRASPRLRGYRL